MNDNAAFDAAAADRDPIISFSPAVRRGSHVLVGLYGFSGSGKTLSALYLARGIVGDAGRICMIDTETGRGLIYAMEAGGFDHAELTPPFTPERYIEAIRVAEEAGYDALILDSGSHEWEGIGGVIEIADANNLKGLVKWAGPKARHKKYVNALLNTRMHIVICLRAKEKMIQVTAANQAKYPGAKIGDIINEGMIAIQDRRFIYEMTAQLFLPIPTGPGEPRGVPVPEKCPKDLLAAFPAGEQISVDTGRRIADWVAGGEPIDHATAELRRLAEETAGHGTARMREWWGGLDNHRKRRLAPHLANLRSIASTADEEAARQASGPDAAADHDGLGDPFAGATAPARPAATATPNGGEADGPPADSTPTPPSAPATDAPDPAPAALDVPPFPADGNAASAVSWRKAAIAAIEGCDSDGAILAFLGRADVKSAPGEASRAVDVVASRRLDQLAAGE